MTYLRKGCLIFSLLILSVTLVFSDSPVGEITQIEGSVQVDTFGTGAYITAIRYEVLYAESVVSTGSDSKAVISIGDQVTVVPSNTKQNIKDLLISEPRVKRFGWVRALTGAVKSAFSTITGTKDEVVLGGRAASATAPKVGWISEDEDKDAFDAALDLIEVGSFADAAEELSSIVDPLPGTFLPAEVEFWLGYSYFQLEQYSDAKDSLLAGITSLGNERLDPWTLPFYEQMVFQAAASSYFTGEYAKSVELIEPVITRISADYAPFAYLVLIDSLNETGNDQDAVKYLQDARKKYSGTEFAGDFSELVGGQ
ncbi:MAG: hypothetical protein HN368_12975 [Spirochaetales bacterium]|jgi:TolA-binding protein|nr:hypothetical protein [Spirochaetales bacterium]